MGRWLAVVAAVSLVLAGCVNLDRFSRGPSSPQEAVDSLPGVGEVDLSDARVQVEGTDCREASLLADANATRVRHRLPANRTPAYGDGDETRLAIVAVRCAEVETAEGSLGPATLLDVSVPVDRPTRQPGRLDQVLWLASDNSRLVGKLGAAGVPVRHASQLELGSQAEYRIAERLSLQAEAGPVDVGGSATAVSVETELPFGTAATIGRDRVVESANGSQLRLEQGLDATEIGGLSATLELGLDTPVAHLVGNTTRSAFGYHARYDVRMGVLPADR